MATHQTKLIAEFRDNRGAFYCSRKAKWRFIEHRKAHKGADKCEFSEQLVSRRRTVF